MDGVLRLGDQARQGEVVPGRGQPLLPGATAAGCLVADLVAGDDRAGRHPVDGEGAGEHLGEVQARGGVQR